MAKNDILEKGKELELWIYMQQCRYMSPSLFFQQATL